MTYTAPHPRFWAAMAGLHVGLLFWHLCADRPWSFLVTLLVALVATANALMGA